MPLIWHQTRAAQSLDGTLSTFFAISLYCMHTCSTLASFLLRGEPFSLVPVCTLLRSRSPHAPNPPPSFGRTAQKLVSPHQELPLHGSPLISAIQRIVISLLPRNTFPSTSHTQHQPSDHGLPRHLPQTSAVTPPPAIRLHG